MSDKLSKVAGPLQTEMLLRKFKSEDSLGPEDDYVLGFLEGQRNAEFQRKLFYESLQGITQIAASRGELNSLAYTRYLIKRLGYDTKK